MTRRTSESTLLTWACRCRTAALLAALAAAGCVSDGAETAPRPDAVAESAGDAQLRFETPDQALQTLLQACRDEDVDLLLDTFGRTHRQLLVTADTAADREGRRAFLEAAELRAKWLERDDGSLELVIGAESWPMAIPLVLEEDGYRFDTEAGAQEALNRRIGNNELETIATCRAYVEAQRAYASRDRDDDAVLEYAQQIRSSPGRRDGLWWPAEEGSEEEVSPFGPLVARAGRNYTEDRAEGDPWMGYYYRILTRQGSNPPAGEYEYVVNGHMIGGFALLAYPAEYGSTGIMTFVVSHQGVVYEKDLGEDTAGIAAEIDAYDPDDTWKAVDGE
jgi:hypothetical protein